MDVSIPPQVTAELTQILSNLVLGDNEIRANSEKAVNDRLAQAPELYMLALAQSAAFTQTEVMRSFSLVLLRRFMFRKHLPVYDHLATNTLETIERLLLQILAREPTKTVRRAAADTISELANHSMSRGRPWHGLQQQAFTMAQSDDLTARESAFEVFSNCPNLIMDLQTDTVLSVLQKGLQDPQSIEVRLIALKAAVAYLAAADLPQQAQSLSLLYPMLNTLPNLPHSRLPSFLLALTSLATSDPALFEPHLPALLKFLPSLILPSVDSGPTPTVARPNPDGQAFTFPPPDAKAKDLESSPEDEETAKVRETALEFMVTLSEARPSMVKRTDGWAAALVRGCLEGMGQIPEGEVEIWLESDPADDPTEETYPYAYQTALDRTATALGGKVVLPPAFQYIPGMLVSHDWRLRHAGLMAITHIAEGTYKVMLKELGRIIELVLPAFNDPHPRVRHAACQCLGQLCTDLADDIQVQYHQQIVNVLIPSLEAPEARVHAHAASAVINFCEGAQHDTLVPYLDTIVDRLLKLLNPGTVGKTPKRYVQEQVITTLAMVADVSEATFVKHYHTIMPLLLNVLQNANTAEYGLLRAKAMECAGLIAIAVGRDVFRPDASALCELLIRIQNSNSSEEDPMLVTYTIGAWAKVCQALGPEFEPYLPAVMPPCLTAAAAKADLSVYDEDETLEDRPGWEFFALDGRQIGIQTSIMEDKHHAFNTLLIYCSTLGPHFAPYLSQTLELTLPALRFVFHDGVRETASFLVPALLTCGKDSGTLTPQMVSASFTQVVNAIAMEADPSYLTSLLKCFSECMRVAGGAASLPHEVREGVVEASKRQLQSTADRRRARERMSSRDIEDRREDLMLIGDVEDIALDEIRDILTEFDPNHPLLVAVGSVSELGLHLKEIDDDYTGNAG